MIFRRVKRLLFSVAIVSACFFVFPIRGKVTRAEEPEIAVNREKSSVSEEEIVHEYAEEKTIDKEATCIEAGSQSIHCVLCGEIMEETVEIIPIKEHVYDEWKVTIPATYDNEGESRRECVCCGEVETKSVKKLVGKWKRNKTGWWYELSKGSYYANCRKMIDGSLYSFNSKGYMQTGWVWKESAWTYHQSGGAASKGWQRVGGSWYYLDEDCIMKTGWQLINDKWYYMNGSGVMKTGWQYLGRKWYYLDGSGAMKTGWQKVNGKWYYLTETGAMQTGWKKINKTWYYMNGSGAMQTGWLQSGNKWYYMNGSGAMQTGWQRLGRHWYYFYKENDTNSGSGDSCGSMAVNKTIDGWIVRESGRAYQEGQIEKTIEQIKAFVGVPYRLGGIGPSGWDCSGFTRWALNLLGVDIPKRSAQQALGGIAVSKNNMSLWKPGDVLIYKSGSRVNHVALYLGDGMLMHALSTKSGTKIHEVSFYEKWDKKNTLAGVRRYL